MCFLIASLYSSCASGSARFRPILCQLACSAFAVENISSISASSCRGSSTPSLPNTFMPLNCGGLCDAVIMMPPSSLWFLAVNWIHGVGANPPKWTVHPVAAKPLETISASIRLLVLLSYPMMTSPPSKKVPIDSAILNTKSGVSVSLITPRIPFEPNS